MSTQAVLRNTSSGHQVVRFTNDQQLLGLLTPLHSIPPNVATVKVPRNACVYWEGDPVGQLYEVVSGAVRACRVLADGRRQIGAFYLPGDIFGLETEADHLFSAEAVVDTQVLIVKSPIVPFDQWDIQDAPHIWEAMRCELRRTRDHVLMLGKTAHERVASFLLEMAERIASSDEVELPMPRQDIADYLGLTIETISRTLAQLESRSMIAMPTSKRIVLRKRATLRKLAE